LTDSLTIQRRTENMRRIRATNTRPELRVRQMAHAMGYRFRLHVSGLPGKPDIVFPRLKKIIDVRGCFWHQHRGCGDSHIPKSREEYWKPKLEKNCVRDARNASALRRQGYGILVVWECEIRNEARLKRRLERFLGA
jgi:DNA mismatch endonuclease, patch repair protein